MGSHKMKLFPQYFNALREGIKYIEVRCNDEKRQQIRVGDHITFSNLETQEEIQTEVTALEVYPSFEELIHQHPVEAYGFKGTPTDEVLEVLKTIYSREQEQRYGALGLVLKRI